MLAFLEPAHMGAASEPMFGHARVPWDCSHGGRWLGAGREGHTNAPWICSREGQVATQRLGYSLTTYANVCVFQKNEKGLLMLFSFVGRGHQAERHAHTWDVTISTWDMMIDGTSETVACPSKQKMNLITCPAAHDNSHLKRTEAPFAWKFKAHKAETWLRILLAEFLQ